MKTTDLGRAGASIEARMAKKERLRYYKAGFVDGYKLAKEDIIAIAENTRLDAEERYADQGVTNIEIHLPNEGEV